MKFCVDAGNTRIKWAIGSGEHWQQFGQHPTAQAAELDWSDWDAPSGQVWIVLASDQDGNLYEARLN